MMSVFQKPNINLFHLEFPIIRENFLAVDWSGTIFFNQLSELFKFFDVTSNDIYGYIWNLELTKSVLESDISASKITSH